MEADTTLEYLRAKERREEIGQTIAAFTFVAMVLLGFGIENPEATIVGLNAWIVLGCLSIFVPRTEHINIHVGCKSDLIAIPLLGGVLWIAVLFVYGYLLSDKTKKNFYNRL